MSHSGPCSIVAPRGGTQLELSSFLTVTAAHGFMAAFSSLLEVTPSLVRRKSLHMRFEWPVDWMELDDVRGPLYPNVTQYLLNFISLTWIHLMVSVADIHGLPQKCTVPSVSPECSHSALRLTHIG
jgi:hypothetical protein